MSQTKKLGRFADGPEVTIDANGHCELPASMTSVPERAFWHWDGYWEGCKALKRISIPSSVTQIGNGAFYRCNSLEAIDVPASVTEIGDEAFAFCSSLEHVTIPASVTKIGYAAFFDTSLKSVIVPTTATLGLYAFDDTTTITRLTPAVMEARRRLRLWSRTWFRLRVVVLFWQERAAISSCAEGGAGRKRDREDFEADNAM